MKRCQYPPYQLVRLDDRWEVGGRYAKDHRIWYIKWNGRTIYEGVSRKIWLEVVKDKVKQTKERRIDK